MKKLFLLFVLLVSITAFSQSINDYQYVIVPIKYDFFKENDKYRLNTLTKLLFQKYGFKSYLSSEEIPKEVENSRCDMLYASVKDESNFMVTKLKVLVKDCREKIIYETEIGTSRNKDFATAYNEAFREAGKSFDKLNYKYNGINNSLIITEPINTSVTETNSETYYFAQPITNGFQVVDNEPKVIMKLYNTSLKNVFLAIRGAINGVLISKENQWVFEYYENGKIVSESLKLKF
ncbi:MAG: hypothetical protein NT048_09305 [Flavobacterium sp.]|nr:hypothetical protein [Flavobacterium sp.]